MSDTQTVTVADAYARRLWEAGTLETRSKQRIHDIEQRDDAYICFVGQVACYRVGGIGLLDYTPPAAPDPRDAEIARLTQERDAAIAENAMLKDVFKRLIAYAPPRKPINIEWSQVKNYNKTLLAATFAQRAGENTWWDVAQTLRAELERITGSKGA